MRAARQGEELTKARMLFLLVSYLLVFGFAARLWLGQATERLPEDLSSDGWLIYWILDWVGDSLQGAPFAVFDPPINWPASNQLASSEHFGSFQLLYLPLRGLLGNELAALNVTIFLAYVLASWLAALLLQRLGCSTTVAWIGGLCFGPVDLAFGTVAALPHVLQIAHLVLPWVVLCLVQLRDRPNARNGLHLAVALTIGGLSSYYMAVLLIFLASTWAVFELIRPQPARGRFLFVCGGSALGAAVLLSLISMPYFSRPEIRGDPDASYSRWGTDHLRAHEMTSQEQEARAQAFQDKTGYSEASIARLGFVHRLFLSNVPWWSSFLGLVALLSAVIGRKAFPRALFGGFILWVVGILVSSSFLPFFGDASVTSPVAWLIQETPARFIRGMERFSPMWLLGAVLVMSAGLETVRNWSAKWPFAVLAVLILLGQVDRKWDPGSFFQEDRVDPSTLPRWRIAKFFSPVLQENTTLTTYRAAYETIAKVLHENGGGPILELPARDDRPETLVGQRILEQPNIFFYTGYPPPHSRLIESLARDLPDPSALRDLAAITGLEWLLVRRDTQAGERLAKALENRPGIQRTVEEQWRISDFLLMKITPDLQNPEWIEAVRAGPQPGKSLLGHPLVALSPDELNYFVHLEPESQVSTGLPADHAVSIANVGPTLVAARSDRPEEKFSVRLRLEWIPQQEGLAVPEATLVPLPRDIPGNTSLIQRVRVDSPKEEGDYVLTARIEQIGNPQILAAAADKPQARLGHSRVRAVPLTDAEKASSGFRSTAPDDDPGRPAR